MNIFKLKFRSALHVDEKGSGSPETASEFIRSDTLSAAISIAWAKLFTEDRLAVFSDPPFRISSAFPYIGDILIFPVPVW
jgi:CRISPR-associated protein Csm4